MTIDEFVTTAEEIINTIQNTYNNYIKTINKYIDDLESILNSGTKYSDEYKNRKLKEINGKIQKAADSANRVIESKKQDINEWYKSQAKTIIENTVKNTLSKVGTPPIGEVLETAINAIPIPELPMPDLKITISEIKIKDFESSNISLPRL